MILDKNLLVSSAQAFTSTAVSDVIDMSQFRDAAPGQPIQLLVQISTAFTTSNGGTLVVQFQGSSDNSTYSTYAESRTYAVTELDAVGTRLLDMDVPRPSGEAVLPRYYRFNYVVANAFTGGALTAEIGMLGREDQVAYAPGVAISN